MKRRAQTIPDSRGRAAGLVLAAAIATGGAWLAHELGPKPETRVEASAPAARPERAAEPPAPPPASGYAALLESLRPGAAPVSDPSSDFPGDDPAGVPRLPGSRRVFATTPATGTGAMAFYEVETPVAEVREFYVREMTARFWTPSPFQTRQLGALGALVFTQGSRTFTVMIERTRNDAATGVVVVVR
jgi:hypothetical protein